MKLNDLASFIHVVDLGTFTAAAAHEGVPKSTISRRIARLEDELGLELLRRSARSFTVTDDGKLLHRRSTSALQELMDVKQTLTETSSTPRGHLVISVPDLGRSEIFVELIETYRKRHPQVSIELRLEDRVVELLREGVDIAIRAHDNTIPGSNQLMSKTFHLSLIQFYASPSYIQQHGMPQTPSELKMHSTILHTVAVSRPIPLTSEANATTVTIDTPAIQVNDFMLGRSLIEAGIGVGMLPQYAIGQALENGALVRVLPEWSTHPIRFSLVWPTSRHLAARVRTFVDMTKEFFEEHTS